MLRLSEALVCFRASGDNFLRFITRAIVNKNDGKMYNLEKYTENHDSNNPRKRQITTKMDPSQNRQKQPLPNPKQSENVPKQPKSNKHLPKNNRTPLKTIPPMGGPPHSEVSMFPIVCGLLFIVVGLF